MPESLGQAEDGLRLARRVDRRDERLRRATRCRPVVRELRRWCRSLPCELLGQLFVQLLALARQDRRVDRLGEERVAETEAACLLLGDEDAVLDGAAQRLAQIALGQSSRPKQRIPHLAPGGGRDTQQALRRAVEPRDAQQQHVAETARELAALLPGRSEELLGEEWVALGASNDRVRQRDGVELPARAVSSSVRSSCPSGPSSSMTVEPARRTPSANRRMRNPDEASSARYVPRIRTRRPSRL